MEAVSGRRHLWSLFRAGTADFRQRSLREQALFIGKKIQGTDVYVKPEEVSRKEYIRKMNHEMKKSNRVKIAQNI